MKKSFLQFLILLLAIIPFSGSAQILEPVKWRFSTEKLGNNEYNLVFIADIDPKWHLYSQDIPMSPPATTFTFEQPKGFELLGKVTESASVEQYDPNFEMVLKFFSRMATFKQRVRVTSDKPVDVKGFVEFMSCDDSRCLPPAEENFSFRLSPDNIQQAQSATTSFNPAASEASQGPLNPVKWSYRIEKQSDKEWEIVFDANIEAGFHLYSLHIPNNGPLPTEFTFQPADNFSLQGSVFEAFEGKIKFDEIFEMDISSFEERADFRQKILLSGTAPYRLSGEIAYMVCNDVGCVALYHDFSLEITTDGQVIDLNDQQALTVQQGPVRADIAGGDAGLWLFFFLAFLGGLAAIVTPCVFPMIPMTVSFFMKDKESKLKGKLQAVVYGLSIIAIYTIIGSILAVVAGPDIANWLSTHWLPNILFFLIFVVFAASFFGMFEITMPHWIVNKSDAKADQGGYVGSIFMALTLVLVSFSCTGPIVGTILVESAGGQVLKPIIGMFGF